MESGRPTAGLRLAHVFFDEPRGLRKYSDPGLQSLDALIETGKTFCSLQPGWYTAEVAKVSPGDVAAMFFTSGTTGNPKGVVHTHNTLLDEPSMGLAPQIVEEVFEIVKDLNQKEKVTFLLAEQNTNMAPRYSNYGYIMECGRVVMDGIASDLANNEDVKEFYLGGGGGKRKSFKDVKSYKRRKRWLA